MANPTTMLALIQRILSPDNTSRKRKRNPGSFSSETSSSSALATTSTDEIDDFRDAIADHSEELYSSTADRERSISEFLALADADTNKPSAKRRRRRKNDQGRLSTIEESEEPEVARVSEAVGHEDDLEMVDVDLGFDVPAGAVHTHKDSHDGMVVSQDEWTWKGGNDLQA